MSLYAKMKAVQGNILKIQTYWFLLYAIHTQVGEKAGAKVNGRMVPSTPNLRQVMVEIGTNANSWS